MIELGEVRTWIGNFSEAISSRVEELNGLDAALADGDYGSSMQRGLQAAAETAESMDTTSVGELLKSVGMALVSAMGGTSGPLVGTFFLRMGTSLGDVGETDVGDWAVAMRAGAEGIMALGGAAPGDKTMLDSLIPAIDTLEASAGESPQAAISAAAVTAHEAADATADLAARRGRASYVGGGGVGHVDPGAVGVSMMFDALEAAVSVSNAGDVV